MLRDEGPVIIGASDAEAAAAFAADLAPDWPELQGVVGAPRRLRCVRARMEASSPGARAALRVRLRQHVLTAVNAVPAAPRHHRASRRRPTRTGSSTARSRSSRKSASPTRPNGCARSCRRASRAAISGSGTTVVRSPMPATTTPRPIRAHRARLHAARLSRTRIRDVARRRAVARAHGHGEREALPDDRRRQSDVQRDLCAHRIPRRKTTIAGSISSPRGPSHGRRPASLDRCALARARRAHDRARRRVGAPRDAVLRLAVGDALTIFDGTGGEYAATLVRADKRGAAVRVERFVPVERESPLALTLAQGIVASDAMDSAVRKATELGVTAIQPLVTARSAPLRDGDHADKRVAHWRQVAIGRRGTVGSQPDPGRCRPARHRRMARGVARYRDRPAAGRRPHAGQDSRRPRRRWPC